MLDGHEGNCVCRQCEMARGYVECGDMELNIANEFAGVESEIVLYAIGACA